MLFVFASELRDHANRLFLALKNGNGPFRGVERWFGFSLENTRVLRLKRFTVNGYSTKDTAILYQKAIEEFLAAEKQRVDLAFVIHPKTEPWDLHSAYVYSKYTLLRANIPTQSVTCELIDNPDLFQWSTANIALAAFAKMGGMPWGIAIDLPDDSLIVGVNRELIYDADTDHPSRWWGFATVFSHNGIFQSMTLFPPANNREAYFQVLEQAISDGIVEWYEKVGVPVNLVIHLRKRISGEEIEVIDRCLKKAGASLVRAYAVLRLSENIGMLVFDPTDRHDPTPPTGTAVMLSPYRAILQVAGRDTRSQSVGRIIGSEPLQVRRERATEGAPTFESLCTHIIALSAMNWRGLNAEASPVSIEYPRQVARLLGRFDRAGFDVGALRGVPNMSRAWFL